MARRSSLPIALLTAGCGGLWALSAAAQDEKALAAATAQLEARVERLEQRMESQQSLLEMLDRIDTLQEENRQLRGDLEEQSHLLNELKQRQEDHYSDLDRRLSEIERLGTSAPAQGGAAQAPAEPAPTPAERDAYQKAFDLLRELRYEQAIDGFRAFLKSYPTGRYASSAQYWLGEAYYARREFAKAITEYQTLLQRYPTSTKAPEALLKIGYSYSVLNKKDEARHTFEELVKLYPQSPEAQQGEAGLRKLNGEAANGR
ncbi:MAG TPA: tol-pal system protein YbgF [Gammaproteobacteria bacterium]